MWPLLWLYSIRRDKLVTSMDSGSRAWLVGVRLPSILVGREVITEDQAPGRNGLDIIGC